MHPFIFSQENKGELIFEWENKFIGLVSEHKLFNR